MNYSRVPGNAVPAWTVFPELEPPEPAIGQPVRRVAAQKRPLPEPVRPIELPLSTIRATTLSFRNMNSYGDLLVRYLRARHEVFITRLGWKLPETDGMEFDQYDTPLCRWVILHEFGDVLGGVRLTPTTAQIGMHSYMLRDAQIGLLDSIPRDVLFFEAPVEDRIWEASRLFIAADVPAQRRAEVQSRLMSEMSRVARSQGATQVIGIVPFVFARWLRRLGLGAVPVGPRFEIDGTKSQAALFNVAATATPPSPSSV